MLVWFVGRGRVLSLDYIPAMQRNIFVYIANFNGTASVPGTVKAVSPPGWFHQPMMNPTGNSVLFWGRETGEVGFNIWVYDRLTGELHKVTNDRAVNGHPFWSADGRRIIFASTVDASDDVEFSYHDQFHTGRKPRSLWIMNHDGTGRRRLTTGPFVDERPCLSRDGRLAVFVSDRSGHMNLWSLDLASGELKQLRRHGGLDYRPIFSRDGKRLAFFTTDHPRATRDLCIMDWATGTLTFPIPPGIFTWCHGPFWLRDDKALLVHAMPVGKENNGLFLFDFATAHVSPIDLAGAKQYSHGSVDDTGTLIAFDSPETLR